MEIRLAKESDAEATVDFLVAFRGEGLSTVLKHSNAPDAEGQQEFISSHDGLTKVMLLALDQGRVVGSLTAAKKGHPQMEHSCEFGMGVLEAKRNNGIGKALIEEMIGWAKSTGVRRIELSVASHNHGAIRLYKRLGFIEEGRKSSAMRVDDMFYDIIDMAMIVEPASRHNSDSRSATISA
jgi:RimJ/RimL family protein N-acetyltransferase